MAMIVWYRVFLPRVASSVTNEGRRPVLVQRHCTGRCIMPVISNSEMILRKMAEEEEAKEEAARQWEASAAERAHKAKMAEQHAAKQARRRWARRCH